MNHALKYVGPHAEVEIAATGDFVERGAVVEVPAEIAGHAPKGDDPGDGLLAQPDNWQPAKATSKTSHAGSSTEE